MFCMNVYVYYVHLRYLERLCVVVALVASVRQIGLLCELVCIFLASFDTKTRLNMQNIRDMCVKKQRVQTLRR
jgi:hypothetical protein